MTRRLPWLALLVVAVTACDPFPHERMREQPKYTPYQRNDFFDDQRAMRPTPPGAIPRERQLGDAALTQGRGPDGKFVQAAPLPLTPQMLKEGRTQFEIYCAACHGLLGDGNSVPARKMSLRPPPSLHEFRDRPDGFFYAVITEGFGFMRPYRDELTVEQRWAVVAYVRALQLSQRMPLDQAPPDVQQRLKEEQQ